MMALYAISSPTWLVGKEETKIINENITTRYRNTLGLYNKCSFIRVRKVYEYETKCYKYATSFSEIGHAAWKACIVFLALAIVLLGIASIFGAVSLCKQLVGRKSLVNLAGTLQAFAGIIVLFCFSC